MKLSKRKMTGLLFWGCSFVLCLAMPAQAQVASKEASNRFLGDTSAVSKSLAVSPDQLLKGRVSGVRVFNTEGSPMSPFMTQIRGVNSTRGSSSPLFIVDGVMLNPADLDVADFFWQYPKWDKPEEIFWQNPQLDYMSKQNALANINPNDIERIEVLKSLSATAIYGPRGANGVVIITTKQGASLKPIITWESNIGVVMPIKNMETMANLQEYKSFQNALWGTIPDLTSLREEVEWQDEMLKPRFVHNHNVSVSGGTNFKYYIGGFYRQFNGVLDNNNTTLGGLRVNMDMRVSEKLSFGSHFTLSYTGANMTKGINPLGTPSLATSLYSAVPARDAQFTPETWLEDFDDFSEEFRATPNFYINTAVIPGLRFNFTAGLDFRFKDRLYWFGNGTPQGEEHNGLGGSSRLSALQYNTKGLFTYDRTIETHHHLSANLGMEVFGSRISLTSQNGKDFFTHFLRAKALEISASRVIPHHYNVDYNQFGIVGGVAYSYRERYNLKGTLNASKTMSYDTELNLYPAVAFTWDVSKEAFFPSIDNIFSTLRLTGGFGKSASEQNQPAAYFGKYFNMDKNADQLYNMATENALLPFYDMFMRTTSHEWNVGLELGFQKDRYLLSLAYYDKYSKDNIYYYRLGRETTKTQSTSEAPVWKYGTRTLEFSDGIHFTNKGFEVDFYGNMLQKGDWKWSLGFNLAFNTNEITKVGTVTDDGSDLYRYGQPIAADGTIANVNMKGEVVGAIFGYRKAGVVTQEMFDNDEVPRLFGAIPNVGDIYFEDQTGEGNIDENDMVVIGNPHPKYFGGLYSEVSYKRFTLNLSIEGAGGHDILNLDRMMRNNLLGTGNITAEAYNNAARAMQTSSPAHPRFRAAGTDMITDEYVEYGDYIRLSQVSLSYNIPLQKQLKWVRSFRVFLNVNNLLTLTAYNGWNPDVNSYGWDNSRLGLSYGAYPDARSLTLGVKATF